MDEEHYLIPRRLDDPPQLFLWDADEAVLFLFFVLLGALLGLLLPGTLAALLLARAFTRIKAEGGRGVIVRFLYWYTPARGWLRTRVPSHVREYIG